MVPWSEIYQVRSEIRKGDISPLKFTHVISTKDIYNYLYATLVSKPAFVGAWLVPLMCNGILSPLVHFKCQANKIL